ncbi:hypothetical protein COCOBI_03-7040 [Coccomyxa sp. Obi]|nr:hypothetical protein COCOBI_03-7040 [Coccomyxa sp. Obi]
MLAWAHIVSDSESEDLAPMEQPEGACEHELFAGMAGVGDGDNQEESDDAQDGFLEAFNRLCQMAPVGLVSPDTDDCEEDTALGDVEVDFLRARGAFNLDDLVAEEDEDAAEDEEAAQQDEPMGCDGDEAQPARKTVDWWRLQRNKPVWKVGGM